MTAVKLDLYFSIYCCLKNDHASKIMKE